MKYFFWLDFEMSGLNPAQDRILEAALLVTDLSFKVVEQYESVVYQKAEVLTGMDPWCQKQHEKTGLTAKVPDGKVESEVENDLVKIIKKFSSTEKAILAGNSIGQDRRFIDQWMPRFSETLHYRMLDVSSFKIIFEHIYKKKYEKKNKHRAVDDILESIAELQYYMQFIKIEV